MSLTVSVLQGGTNSHETSSEEVNAIATDFVSEGVVGAITNTSGVAPATGGFAVNAQSTPDMTVAVSAGTAYVTGTPTSGNSQTVRVKNSASANVTISANSTGGTRYDWVYIELDPDAMKDPASDASDVASLTTSRSTSASTDNGTPPTYGYAIAVVTVANGASSVTNGNITDARISTGATPSDSSVITAKINDAAVTPDKLGTGAGAAYVATSETTTSTSYTNLTTTTDSVTVTVGANGLALVNVAAYMNNNTASAFTKVAVDVSGATTIAASDTYAIALQCYAGLAAARQTGTWLFTGLTPGSTTFKMKYAVLSGGSGSGTGTFANRRIAVVPL